MGNDCVTSLNFSEIPTCVLPVNMAFFVFIKLLYELRALDEQHNSMADFFLHGFSIFDCTTTRIIYTCSLFGLRCSFAVHLSWLTYLREEKWDYLSVWIGTWRVNILRGCRGRDSQEVWVRIFVGMIVLILEAVGFAGDILILTGWLLGISAGNGFAGMPFCC